MKRQLISKENLWWLSNGECIKVGDMEIKLDESLRKDYGGCLQFAITQMEEYLKTNNKDESREKNL